MADSRLSTLTTAAVVVAVIAALAVPAAALGSTDTRTTDTRATDTDTPTPTPTPRNGTASVTFSDQQAESTVTVDSVSLSEGGFVVVYNSSGNVVGVSEYLESGSYEALEIDVSPAFSSSDVAIAEVHYDNGDQSFNASEDVAYESGGMPVSDTALVSPDGFSRTTDTQTATATPTEAVTDTQTATDTATEAGTDATTETETSTSTPGFTAVLALLALVAAALLAIRS